MLVPYKYLLQIIFDRYQAIGNERRHHYIELGTNNSNKKLHPSKAYVPILRHYYVVVNTIIQPAETRKLQTFIFFNYFFNCKLKLLYQHKISMSTNYIINQCMYETKRSLFEPHPFHN